MWKVSDSRQTGKWRTWRVPALALLLLCLLVVSVAAAADGFNLGWAQVVAGGGTVNGAEYSAQGTLGQPEAGAVSMGGPYTVAGGVWGVAERTEQRRTQYLPVISRD